MTNERYTSRKVCACGNELVIEYISCQEAGSLAKSWLIDAHGSGYIESAHGVSFVCCFQCQRRHSLAQLELPAGPPRPSWLRRALWLVRV
jgi:hypothetical protein